MQFPEKLVQLRKRRGLTQAQAVEAVRAGAALCTFSPCILI